MLPDQSAPIHTECSDCTVPTSDPSGLCTFCQDYEPPADPLELADGLVDSAAQVIRTALQDGDFGITTAIDLSTAHAHMIAATRLIASAQEGRR